MNKTAELVLLWARYEETHPDAEIRDFCSEHLLSERKSHQHTEFLADFVPAEKESVLAKLLGRLVKLHTTYAMMTLKEKGIGSFEEFTFLNTILATGNPRKSDVINENFIELSSGLLVIDRLKNRGYITETDDENDKRSKRVELTADGKEKIQACHQLMDKLNKSFYNDLPETDINLLIEMLKPLEIKLSSLWLRNRKKPFDEIYKGSG